MHTKEQLLEQYTKFIEMCRSSELYYVSRRWDVGRIDPKMLDGNVVDGTITLWSKFWQSQLHQERIFGSEEEAKEFAEENYKEQINKRDKELKLAIGRSKVTIEDLEKLGYL